MLNKDLLKTEIFKNGFNIASLSKELNINPSTFFRKLQKDGFTIGEARQIFKVLNLTKEKAVDIFFSE